MIDNVAHIIAIEWLAAAQGIDFLRPLKSSPHLEEAHALLRAQVTRMDHDRVISTDIALAVDLIRKGALAQILQSISTCQRLCQDMNSE
jgi:histidine ammonia-lyase